jgi:hypothetical protein
MNFNPIAASHAGAHHDGKDALGLTMPAPSGWGGWPKACLDRLDHGLRVSVDLI